MGGVAVLQPEDLFNHQNHGHHIISPAMKSQSRSSNRRTRSPQKNTTSPLKEYNNHRSSPSSSKPTSINPVVVAPIKILKRGEASTITATHYSSSSDLTLKEQQQQPVQKAAATSKKKKMGAGVSHDSVLLGPPENDLKQGHLLISSDCYAGSAFVSSPPPSSLPVPAFFKKKNLVLADGNNTTNCNSNSNSNSNNGGDATTDLLRLLRIDLSWVKVGRHGGLISVPKIFFLKKERILMKNGKMEGKGAGLLRFAVTSFIFSRGSRITKTNLPSLSSFPSLFFKEKCFSSASSNFRPPFRLELYI